MKKKILLTFVAVAAVAVGVVGMSAFEAHVINVTAMIENALQVNTEPIQFGTVFPQEAIDREINIALSSSFQAEGRVDDVNYVIRQKPKCQLVTTEDLPEFGRVIEVNGEFVCADEANYDMLPVLCPFLSKHEMTQEDPENDGLGINAFHGPISGWNLQNTLDTQVAGRLAKSDNDYDDTWKIDFRVPCFKDECAQDWDTFVSTNNPDAVAAEYILPNELEHELFGCDLWIEVSDVSRLETVDLENKTADWVIIAGDQIDGTIAYSTGKNTFYGNVTGQGLVPDSKYQITLNGPGPCTATDNQLASGPGNLFSSGYWNGGPSLAATCGTPGEGIHNMDLISDWYTVITDSNGDFSHPFNIALPSGSYSGVKVLVKKMLDTYVSPWVDQTGNWQATNLFETAPISFVVN